MAKQRTKVAVVGGGLAGLACAKAVADRGIDVTVLEAADRPGGRVATDEVDGFLIDRGFQVLLSAYPEIDVHFDRDALNLRPFDRGALVRKGARFRLIADPFSKPLKAPKMLTDGLIRPRDTVATLRLLRSARDERGPHGGIHSPDSTIAEALARAGASKSLTEAFWRPFLAGITLDSSLSTSARFLDFLLANFAAGPACVPGDGMRRLPQLLAASLPIDTVRTGARVKRIEKGRVTLADGDRVDADLIVVATDARSASKLLDDLPDPGWSSVGQIAFDAGPRPPHAEPILVLDGEGRGPVNNLQVMSNAASGYAPTGRSLVTCSILEQHLDDDDERLERAVRDQLGGWYGPVVEDWRLLRIDRIKRALPKQPPGSLDPIERPLRLRRWLWAAGDHRATSSIEGALSSGRHAGEQAAAALAELA